MSGYFFGGALTEILNSLNSVYEQIPPKENILNAVNSAIEQMPTILMVESESIDAVNKNNEILFGENAENNNNDENVETAKTDVVENSSIIGGMLDYMFTQESPNNADILNQTVLNEKTGTITANLVYNILDDIKNSPNIVADLGKTITTTVNEVLSNPLTTALAAVGIATSEHEKFNTDVFLGMLDNFLENHKDSKNYDEIRFYLGLLLTKYFNIERVGKNSELDKELLAKMDVDFSENKLKDFFDKYKLGQKEETRNGISVFIGGLFPNNKNSQAEPLDHERIKKYIDEKLTLTFKQYVLMKSRSAYNSVVDILKYLEKCFSNALKKPIHMYVDSKFSGERARKSTEDIVKKGVTNKFGETAGNIAVDILKATGLNESKTVQQYTKDQVHKHVDEKVNIKPSKIIKKIASKGRVKAKNIYKKTTNKTKDLNRMIKKTINFSGKDKTSKSATNNDNHTRSIYDPTQGKKRTP